LQVLVPSALRRALLLRSTAWCAIGSDFEIPSHGSALRLFCRIPIVERRGTSDLSSCSPNRSTTGRDDAVLSPAGRRQTDETYRRQT
jgi:hypothetical protein